MPLQIANRIFIENDSRSTGKVGKVLGVTQLTRDGDESILYSIHDGFTGQCISQKEAAYVRDFDRYFKTGKLLWRQ